MSSSIIERIESFVGDIGVITFIRELPFSLQAG